jgi:hypothetical protein
VVKVRPVPGWHSRSPHISLVLLLSTVLEVVLLRFQLDFTRDPRISPWRSSARLCPTAHPSGSTLPVLVASAVLVKPTKGSNNLYLEIASNLLVPACRVSEEDVGIRPARLCP